MYIYKEPRDCLGLVISFVRSSLRSRSLFSNRRCTDRRSVVLGCLAYAPPAPCYRSSPCVGFTTVVILTTKRPSYPRGPLNKAGPYSSSNYSHSQSIYGRVQVRARYLGPA